MLLLQLSTRAEEQQFLKQQQTGMTFDAMNGLNRSLCTLTAVIVRIFGRACVFCSEFYLLIKSAGSKVVTGLSEKDERRGGRRVNEAACKDADVF
jgi:hypothetical protein